MATPPFNLDTGDPLDNAPVTPFPSNERPFRDNVASYLNTEHDPATGRHRIANGNTTQRNAQTGIAAGNLYFTLDVGPNGGRLQYFNGSSWLDAFQYPDIIPVGTKMVFRQATAPTGWLQDGSINDMVLRVVSGAGGGTGGTWSIGGVTVTPTIASHVLSVTELPSHTHVVNTVANQTTQANVVGNIAGTTPATGTANYTTDGGTGGNGGHSHPGSTCTFSNDATWRPAYADIIICSKN